MLRKRLSFLSSLVGLSYLLVLYLSLIFPSQEIIAAKPLTIGINLSSVSYWSTQLPFVDIFKTASGWFAQKPDVWDTKEPLNLDQNGWVKSLPQNGYVGTIINRVNGHYPGGQYLVLYQGEGKLEYGMDALKLTNLSQKGKDVITVTPSAAGIYLKITALNPQNYIRNLRIIPANYEQNPPLFNPEFLSKIKPFKTLRFMDWMETNNSVQREWGDRPKPTQATWFRSGVPVEIMVALANELEVNPWFCMPHQASDDYIIRFATYVKTHLKPELTIYVEYSNEVWNPQFAQFHWVAQQAQAQESSKEKVYDWYSKRTTEVTRLWDEVFAQDKARIIGVMGAQATSAWQGKRVLDYSKWGGISGAHEEYGIDVLAIAPYMGDYLLKTPQTRAKVKKWTIQLDGGLDLLFDELNYGGLHPRHQGAVDLIAESIQEYQTIASEHKLPLIAYEGGQHLVGGNDSAITNLFIKANRDQRMGELYRAYLKKWQELGGGLFVHFNDIRQSNENGSWGALEYVGEATSPKYQALVDLINQQRR